MIHYGTPQQWRGADILTTHQRMIRHDTLFHTTPHQKNGGNHAIHSHCTTRQSIARHAMSPYGTTQQITLHHNMTLQDILHHLTTRHVLDDFGSTSRHIMALYVTARNVTTHHATPQHLRNNLTLIYIHHDIPSQHTIAKYSTVQNLTSIHSTAQYDATILEM
jgi:hypothetical protein